MRCKWCNKEYKKLAKSHIIPKAFAIPDGKNDRFIVTANSHKKKRPIGSWDDTILCQQCEKQYQYIDNNGAQILLKNFDKLIIPFNDKKDEVAIQIGVHHLYDLKVFLIYTLWKASVSSLTEFRRIKLGPYEEKIKSDIISKRELGAHEYGFVGCYIDNPIGVIMPFKRNKKNYDGCTFYNLDLSSFEFDVKIDSRKMPATYRFIVEHENTLFLKLKDPSSKRRQSMVEVVKAHEEKFGKNKT
jgi:hypothetical protein